MNSSIVLTQVSPIFLRSVDSSSSHFCLVPDPEGKYIQHRLYRDSCLPVEGNFLKDLTVLGRDLAQTILVDNSPHAFGYQVENGIPIESWFEDPDDRELVKLERFLRQHCLDVSDVRPVLDKKFQCRRLVNEAPPLLFGDE